MLDGYIIVREDGCSLASKRALPACRKRQILFTDQIELAELFALRAEAEEAVERLQSRQRLKLRLSRVAVGTIRSNLGTASNSPVRRRLPGSFETGTRR